MSYLLLFCLGQWVFGLLKKLERAYKKKKKTNKRNNKQPAMGSRSTRRLSTRPFLKRFDEICHLPVKILTIHYLINFHILFSKYL